MIMVPCNDILIGKWRRMNTGTNDLLVYLSESRKTLTYYVRSADMGFKMRIPFDSVVGTEYIHEFAPGCDRAVFLLSKPPTFYREVASRTGSATSSGRTWRPANDWTESAQASTCTRHEITGPTRRLAMALGPLLTVGSSSTPLLHPAPSVSRSSIASTFFHPSPSLSYSPSSVSTSASSGNSPPGRASPTQYYSGMPTETTASRPSTSNGSLKEDSHTFQPRHGRTRSRSQPPMLFPFSADGLSQINVAPMPPHTASLVSGGFLMDFDPFAHSMGNTINGGQTGLDFGAGGEQLPILAQQGYQQQPSNQALGFPYPQSDVCLLPEHMTSTRPLSSGGFGFPDPTSGLSSSHGNPAPTGLRTGESSLDGLASLTQTQAPSSGQPNGSSGSGPRFMDIYSSQNLNISSYILGSNGMDDSRMFHAIPSLISPSLASMSISQAVPTPTQPQYPATLSSPFNFSAHPASGPRTSEMNEEQPRTPSIYDHVGERVAFPA